VFVVEDNLVVVEDNLVVVEDNPVAEDNPVEDKQFAVQDCTEGLLVEQKLGFAMVDSPRYLLRDGQLLLHINHNSNNK